MADKPLVDQLRDMLLADPQVGVTIQLLRQGAEAACDTIEKVAREQHPRGDTPELRLALSLLVPGIIAGASALGHQDWCARQPPLFNS